MPLIETHFATRDIWFISIGLALVTGSLLAFVKEKHKIALLLLVLGGALLRIMLLLIDPFLHPWDEQFHALVALNLTKHPFHPTLIDYPVLPYHAADWTANHTWLHKPPFFLWVIAGSIKCFGASVYSVRFPFLLLGVLLIIIIYRIGQLLLNKETGFIAALFYTVSGFQLHLISGQLNTDHNDTFFFALITLACWCICEYACGNHSLKWMLLCGIFSGAAILTKYLPGLLPLGIAGLLLLQSEWRKDKTIWMHLLWAIIVCATISIPWYWYSSMRWPEETDAVRNLYTQHLSSDLGHSGSWYYHFNELVTNYDWWFVILIIPGVILLLRNTNQKALVWSLVAGTGMVYLFYSLVQTRMPLFCLPVSFFLFITVAVAIATLLAVIKNYIDKYLSVIKIIILLFLSLQLLYLGRLEFLHCDRDGNDISRQTRLHNKKVLEEVATRENDNYILFNCGFYTHISAMFYTGQTAYSRLPDETELIRLKENKSIRLLIFDDGNLPEYIRNDAALIILPDKLMRTGY